MLSMQKNHKFSKFIYTNSCDFSIFRLKTHGRLITYHGETVIFTMFYYWKKNYKPLMVYKRNKNGLLVIKHCSVTRAKTLVYQESTMQNCVRIFGIYELKLSTNKISKKSIKIEYQYNLVVISSLFKIAFVALYCPNSLFHNRNGLERIQRNLSGCPSDVR